MCFDTDSFPPIPVISGAAVSHDDLVLEAADGNRFAAFSAAPDEPGTTGVVILPDVRGLYRFYEELALRFAERGYPAAAFDYFGRTAGVEKRDDEFDYMPHVQETGLFRFYEELALRFAERGYPAAAFDYFGRTAGVEKRDDEFDYMPHVQE